MVYNIADTVYRRVGGIFVHKICGFIRKFPVL